MIYDGDLLFGDAIKCMIKFMHDPIRYIENVPATRLT